tara:strand:- start:36 stop:860 length:825 start_codon:yes stop_codon:yes gene_type:complete
MIKVQILLATYNGEKYLSDQLKSILDQTFQNWELLISDDNSTDNTQIIIDQFLKLYPSKIRQVHVDKKGSSTANFMSLLNFVTAPYIMFCDQDDYWHNNKMENSVECIERVVEKNKVALVYTDMEVVDSELKILYSSFLKQQGLNPKWRNSSNAVFSQSMAAGCSMIFTKSLIDCLHPIQEKLFQHDHWILMHAAFYGKVEFIPKSLVKYRQHQHNAIGSHHSGINYFFGKLKDLNKIIQRWVYIKAQFGSSISLFNLGIIKFKLNMLRLLSKR